ncbi:hypothetical protein LTR36_009439 [Oleoguttula mirabilis]|uniref:SAC3/GANP/THP3 conserved domain-containing protein n=1 Tax=Oleoguttula mirabilis TaxID=1507867 RepID=A0AAV9JTC5_9PEZI|nr:hypothetical protein LTR36_009439 [Oleoguttula mirabilis]
MSSASAKGGVRGRGRGSGGAARGASTKGNNARDSPASRATFGQPSRGNSGTRGATPNGLRPPPQNKTGSGSGSAFGGGAPKGSWTQRYDSLTNSRERERRQAIAQGLIADPDKPRSLADAITPVATCQDMCAEYERAQRAVQNDVWGEETDPNHSVYSVGKAEPDEARMVKKFRRAAAGVEEQLPSDLRPPDVLRRTCDYLFHEVVGNAPKLEKVHHFVWDRTRAIRNDFSIQQVTKVEDLRLAIDCYERIARFHIVSLHQLAVLPRPYDKYDAQQEREQLDRTLLSLMQYYDDSRGRVDLPNEAEFRAYCVIFQLQDPMPDLEDRVQSWPRHVVMDGRVQKALELYAAACNTMDSQGPLKPRASHLLAQQDWQRFWILADSKEISYLMACVAEIYFNLVRRTALNALWRSFRQSPNRSPDDWTIDALCELFALDEEEQVVTFCEAYGFSFAQRADGQQYLDLASVKDRSLPQPNVGLPKQWRSELVESKRYGRILPAIIDGLAVKQAEQVGMVIEVEDDEMEMDDGVASSQTPRNPFLADNSDPTDGEDSNSLFIPEDRDQGATENKAPAGQPLTNGFSGASGQLKTFGAPSNGFGFGKPSGVPSSSKPSIGESLFTPNASISTSAPAAAGQSPFDFLSGPSAQTATPALFATTTPAPQPAFTPPRFEPGASFKFSSPPVAKSDTAEAPKNSFGAPTGDQQSIFSQATANGDSAETSPTQAFPFPKSSAPAKASEENGDNPATGSFQTYKQPSLESAPTSPEKAFTFDEPAAASGPTTSSATKVTQPETKASQPHFTPSNPAQPTTSANGAALPSSLGRKPSAGPHQVKRPSPLSNSISSEDVSNSKATGESSSRAAGRQPVKEPSLNRPNTGAFEAKSRAHSEAHSQAQIPGALKDDLAYIVTRLADEITNDEIAGFLTQYVEFAVQQAITSVQASVTLERDTAEADRFRKAVLFRRYFKRWKEVFWGRKFAKRGNKRRERARRGLEELRRSQGSDTNSLLANSRATSVAGSAMDDVEARRKTVDRIFQHTVRSRPRPGAVSDEQHATTGSKRPLSSHGRDGRDTASVVREGGHKRMKSTSHVDDRGRITKPAPTSNPNADILKRSSFLGFTMPSAPLNGKRSNYFRLKAMGVEPGEGVRGTKRRREESSEGTPRTSPPHMRMSSQSTSSLRMSTLLQSTTEQPSMDATMRVPSSASTTDVLDEALFARLKAARESLAQSSTYLQDEVAKENEFKRSLGASQSSNDSPSMVRARVEARLRASHAASTTGTAEPASDVPAYRLRESRFVPREQYGRAIERAKEMRETRSRDSSRPESRAEWEGLPTTSAPAVQMPQLNTTAFAAAPQTFSGVQAQATKVPNGLPNSRLAQWQPPSIAQTTQPFSQTPQSAGWGFSNAAGQASGFKSLAETPINPFSTFASQPTQAVGYAQPRSSPLADGHDFTIQPSQMQQSLSNSFGNSQPQDFGQQPFHDFEQQSPTPPRPDSYMHSQSLSQQAFSLLADECEQEPPAYASHFAQQPAVNGNADGEYSDDLLDPADDEEVQDSYQYTDGNNVYAALANDLGGDTEEDADEGQSGIDFLSQVDEESADDGHAPNGYAYGYDQQNGGYQDEGLDGDVEDEEDYDSDEELEDDEETEGGTPSIRHEGFTNGDDYTEGEDDEDDIDPRTQRAWNQQPPKNDALQDVGATVEEAIELSD